MKKHSSRKTLAAISVVLTIASVVMTTVWQTPMALATSLEEIKVSREISAPVDKVWDIVSDIDNEAKYWSIIKNIKNINKTDTVTEREVTVQAGPQGDAKTHQIVTVNPEQFVVQTNTTEGPVTGSRVLTLSPSTENNSTTKVDAVWEIDLSGIPLLGKGFAKDSFQKTTEEALSNIAAEAEVK
ncbi:MAG: SRPBCC family protein [Nitrososphaeraceae archaeon]